MLYESAYISLIIQFITGTLDVWGLSINVPENKIIFRDLLKVELFVQTIEFIFYLWMVYNIKNVKNITPYRYLDWLITTPIMLITLSAYLDNNNYKTLDEYLKINKDFIYKIISLNFIMLLFGLFGELNYLNYNTSIIIGFIPFIVYFTMIYDKYIKNKNITKDKSYLFWFFFGVWTLYGVAAFLPYEQKNIMYNILDLFSKNFFGVFLVYVLWKNRYKNSITS
jgi:bacteriorhodopsin